MATNVFDLMATLGLDSSKYDSGLDKAKTAGSMLGSGLATAAKVGLAAVTAATGATVAFAKSSIDAGMSFDQAMGSVAATMGKTMDEMNGQVGSADTSFGHFEGTLRDFAQFMGQNTAFSATQAAEALNYMALAGYNTQQSMDMLPNVLSLAAAGGMELARASDMITDTQSALGIDLERTSLMVDEFAKAASTGNTSVEQLGDAFLTVGGLAKELNGGMVTLADGTQKPVDGIQELEIALTAMANAGIKGGEAGTHMRNMLLKLSSPTSDGTKALEAMGVSVFDTEGKMRSLSDVFGDLNTELGKMTDEQRIQTIADLFNTRDLASAEALLSAVGQDWDKIGGSILDAEGAAAQMAETKLDNLAGDITLFKSALEGARIVISDKLSPELRKFVEFGTEGIQRVSDAFQEGGLTGAMSAFGEVLADGLNMVIEMLPQAIDAGMQLLGAVGQGIIDNLPVIVDVASQVLAMFIQGLASALPSLLNGGLQIVSALGQAVIDNLPQIVTAAVEMIKSIVQFISENVGSMIDGAVEIILALSDGLIEMLPDLIPAIVEIILAIVEGLIDNVDKLIDAAIKINIALAEGLIKSLPKLIEKAPVIIEKLMNAIIENAPKLLKASFELIGMLVEGIVSNLPQVARAAGEIIMTLLSGIGNLFVNVYNTGKEIGDNIKSGFSEFISNAGEWGRDLISNFVDGIWSKIGDVIDAAMSVANTVRDYLGFSEPDKGPLANFHTFAPDMMNLFAEGIKDNEDLITDQIAKSFDFSDVIASQNVNVNGGGTGNVITMNIYGSGYNPDELAEIVSRKLNAVTSRRQIAMGAV